MTEVRVTLPQQLLVRIDDEATRTASTRDSVIAELLSHALMDRVRPAAGATADASAESEAPPFIW